MLIDLWCLNNKIMSSEILNKNNNQISSIISPSIYNSNKIYENKKLDINKLISIARKKEKSEKRQNIIYMSTIAAVLGVFGVIASL